MSNLPHSLLRDLLFLHYISVLIDLCLQLLQPLVDQLVHHFPHLISLHRAAHLGKPCLVVPRDTECPDEAQEGQVLKHLELFTSHWDHSHRRLSNFQVLRLQKSAKEQQLFLVCLELAIFTGDFLDKLAHVSHSVEL